MTKNEQKGAPNFYCKKCDYSTCKKANFDRHILSAKHKMDDKWMTKNEQNEQEKKENFFECSCGKKYKYRQGLHKHQQKCILIKQDNINEDSDKNIDYKDMFLKMMKQNNELMNQVTDLIPKVGNNNNNTINRQKFNINIFLNEECKDAITMNEFIKKIEVSLSNLLTTQNKGISEGVSDIFIENMNKLSLHERPMHCTDVNKEIVYIKSENDGKNSEWKQDIENKELKCALQKISKVQQQNLKKWTDENPNWNKDPKLEKEYMKLVKNATDDLKENAENQITNRKIKTHKDHPAHDDKDEISSNKSDIKVR
mgnify:CR=1 FL=1